MQKMVRVNPSLIPSAEVRNLAVTFLGYVRGLSEDSRVIHEFEEWKERGEHKKYVI